MKKKIIAATVCAAALLSLTACGDKNNTPVNGATSGNTSGPFGGNSSQAVSSSSSQQSSSSSSTTPESKPEKSSSTSTVESVPEESSAPEDNAADFQTEEIISDDGTEALCITKYTGSDEKVVIPETIGGKKVTQIAGAFRGNIDITSVTIPDSVEYLYYYDNDTFAGCINLSEVIFLGNDAPAFFEDTFAKTPWWEAKLAENPDYIEVNNTLVKWLNTDSDVVVPDGITKIVASAFSDDTYVNSITLPDSVTEIGAYAFSYLNNLKSVKLPSKITEIADGTFCQSYHLETLNIPNGVTAIGNNVFDSCVAKITFPDSVKTLGICDDYYTFNGEITYKGKTYSGTNGYNELREVLAIGDGDMQIVDNVLVAVKSSATKIELPDTVTSIADNAFDNCSNDLIIVYKGKNYNPQNIDKLKAAINGN